MEKRRDIFMAIADPTRREIITMLAHMPLNLNAIADHFDTSRPTISQHVKFLQDCGLITINKQGRERYCEAKFDQLTEVSNWAKQATKIWMNRCQSLDKFLTDLNQKNHD